MKGWPRNCANGALTSAWMKNSFKIFITLTASTVGCGGGKSKKGPEKRIGSIGWLLVESIIYQAAVVQNIGRKVESCQGIEQSFSSLKRKILDSFENMVKVLDFLQGKCTHTHTILHAIQRHSRIP